MRTSFHVGKIGFLQNRPVQDVCRTFFEQQIIFCIEGYFNEWAAKTLLKPEIDLDQAVHEAQFILGADQKFLLSVWAVAFGIAAAEKGWPLERLTPLADRNPWLFSYMVDGWAVRARPLWGDRLALEFCVEKIEARFTPVCRWGLGRSLLFYPSPHAAELLKDENIRGGFDFASHFTQNSRLSMDSIAQLEPGGRKIAELGKHALREPASHPLLAPLGECLTRRHAADCARP